MVWETPVLNRPPQIVLVFLFCAFLLFLDLVICYVSPMKFFILPRCLILGALFLQLSLSIPFLGGASQASDALSVLERFEQSPPDIKVADAEGIEVLFSEVLERPVLVNFWASWCAPCIRELPELQELDEALGAEGMGVVLVGLDRGGAEFGEAFLAERGITIEARFYDSSGDLPKELGLKVMPSSFLITQEGEDANKQGGGKVIGKIAGVLNWPSPRVIEAVKAELRP